MGYSPSKQEILKEIVKAIGYNGNFSLKDDFKVHSFESLVNATNKDMTFLNSHKYQNLSLKTKAAACITSSNLFKFLPPHHSYSQVSVNSGTCFRREGNRSAEYIRSHYLNDSRSRVCGQGREAF